MVVLQKVFSVIVRLHECWFANRHFSFCYQYAYFVDKIAKQLFWVQTSSS